MPRFVQRLCILVGFLFCSNRAFAITASPESEPAELFAPDIFSQFHAEPLATFLGLGYSFVAMISAMGLCLWLLGMFHIDSTPEQHWSLRARKAWPVNRYLIVLYLYLPMITGFEVYFLVDGIMFRSLVAFSVCFLVSMVALVLMQLITGHFIHRRPMTWVDIRSLTASFLVYRSIGWIYMVLFWFAFGTEPGWWTVGGIVLAVALLFWLNTVGLLQVLGLLRLISPVEELREVIRALAAKAGVTSEPRIYRIKWSIANAFALFGSHSIVVTDRLFEILSRPELDSVLAHEMAHLSEGKTTQMMRYARLLLPLPLILSPSWIPLVQRLNWDNNLVAASALMIWGSVFGLLLWKRFTIAQTAKKQSWIWSLGGPLYFTILIGGFWFTEAITFQILLSAIGLVSGLWSLMMWRMQAMEKRADESGSEAAEGTVYAQALAKLYEENMVPAVLKGSNLTHPNLYDRLAASGMTPDFPRPEPPRTRLATLLALLTLATGVAVFWLVLTLA